MKAVKVRPNPRECDQSGFAVLESWLVVSLCVDESWSVGKGCKPWPNPGLAWLIRAKQTWPQSTCRWSGPKDEITREWLRKPFSSTNLAVR